MVGHALFGQSHNLPPSVTQGVISKVATFRELPILIQVGVFFSPKMFSTSLVTLILNLIIIAQLHERILYKSDLR